MHDFFLLKLLTFSEQCMIIFLNWIEIKIVAKIALIYYSTYYKYVIRRWIHKRIFFFQKCHVSVWERIILIILKKWKKIKKKIKCDE